MTPTISGTKYLCDMPPGSGPWRLVTLGGVVIAVSPNDGVFRLGSDSRWSRVQCETSGGAVVVEFPRQYQRTNG